MILTSSNLFETLETDPVSGYCVHIVTHAKKKTCVHVYMHVRSAPESSRVRFHILNNTVKVTKTPRVHL